MDKVANTKEYIVAACDNVLAKYGLKYRSFRKWISTENTFFNGEWMYHDYCISTKEKVEKINNAIGRWGV